MLWNFQILNASWALIDTLLRQIENTIFIKSQNSHSSTQKIYKDIKYLIQSLDLCFNDFWLFPFTKTTLLDQFNGIKMTPEVKLASA